MQNYSIVIKRSAAKELESIPGRDRDRIIERIRGLGRDPRPPQCQKLAGQEKYRIRQGDYRILYQIMDEQLVVTVVKVAHRRDVYRR